MISYSWCNLDYCEELLILRLFSPWRAAARGQRTAHQSIILLIDLRLIDENFCVARLPGMGR